MYEQFFYTTHELYFKIFKIMILFKEYKFVTQFFDLKKKKILPSGYFDIQILSSINYSLQIKFPFSSNNYVSYATNLDCGAVVR